MRLLQINYLQSPKMLALLSRGHENIVAAGSFGKTTSVAMMAHCLASAGLDPSWMIGAVPLSPVRASNAGKGRLFLLEGDEYPSSNTDNRSKFLHYRPAHVLLAPLAHDHVNVFPTIQSLSRALSIASLIWSRATGSSSPRPRANSASDFSPKRNAMS